MNQPPRRSATGITGWRKATASDLRTPAESSRLHDQGALEISRFSCMLFLSVRGFLDYAGPDSHSRLTRLPCCLPPSRKGVGILIHRLFEAQSPGPLVPLVYASGDNSRYLLQDSRPGWSRCSPFL